MSDKHSKGVQCLAMIWKWRLIISQASDETHPWRQRGSQSVARTTLVNKPDKYGETIAIVYKLMKKNQEMLFANWAL